SSSNAPPRASSKCRARNIWPRGMARLSGPARATMAGLLLLSLSSCSYSIHVNAAFIDGHLGFVLAPGERDQRTNCLFRLVLSNEAGETVWGIERLEQSLDGCAPWLPLR